MQILPLQLTDLPDLPQIAPEGWYDLRPIHQFYIQAPYCFPFKMNLDGKMVGAGTVIYHENVAWLAHIIVDENHRRKGIGLSITKHLLNHALAKGVKTVYLIATEMGAPVYTKLGFQVETEYIIFKDIQLTNLEPVSNKIVPYQDKYKQDLLNLDQFVTGENRLDTLSLNLSTGHIYISENQLEGFYLPNLGEGVIIAKTKEAGRALVNYRLQDKNNKTAIFPKQNLEGIAYLQELGLSPSGYMKRMYYGEERLVQCKYVYNRIGGNLG